MPESGMPAVAAKAEDEIVSVPVTLPAVEGVKTTSTAQLAPPANEDPHVVSAIPNPVDAVIANLSSATVLLKFVSVSEIGLLVAPTPVLGKFNCCG
jgi:hypothetical protein